VIGLLLLNVAVLGVGASLLWSVRGWRYWTDLMRLGGLAYLLGLSALVVLLTTGVAVGVPFGWPLLIGGGIGLSLIAIIVGRTARVPRPTLRPPGWRISQPPPLVLPFALCIVVYFAMLFRSLRLTPLFETDAWWVWTVRAKALHYFGDLGGADLVGGGATGYPSYPPGLSLVHAAAFEAMGNLDTVTLHLQHWFLAVGFVAAALGLLAGRVRPAIVYPLALLLLSMPGFADRVGWAMADCLLGYLAATGGLLLYLWLEDRAPWQLLASTVLLGGAMLVKREGTIVVACVLVASFAASIAQRREVWPRLVLAGATTLALAAPWRTYLLVSGVRDEPTEGYLAFVEHGDRAWPSLELVLTTFLDPVWFGFGVVALFAIGLAFLCGSRRLPVFAITFAGASFVSSAFVIWSETAFEITQKPSLNPILRMTLVTTLVLAPLVPLLLEASWRAGSHVSRSPG
jgi:hypothetical protein